MLGGAAVGFGGAGLGRGGRWVGFGRVGVGVGGGWIGFGEASETELSTGAWKSGFPALLGFLDLTYMYIPTPAPAAKRRIKMTASASCIACGEQR